jgi:hypothetical protein
VGQKSSPLHPQSLFAADSPKSDLFTTHHISLATRYTEVIGVIGDDLERYQKTHVCCHNVYRSCYRGNYRPGQFDLATLLLLSGLGAVLGRDVFFMSQTSTLVTMFKYKLEYFVRMQTFKTSCTNLGFDRRPFIEVKRGSEPLTTSAARSPYRGNLLCSFLELEMLSE